MPELCSGIFFVYYIHLLPIGFVIFTFMIIKRLLILIFIAFSCALQAQADLVAREYFKNGELEKALSSYKKLYSSNKRNSQYLFKIIKIEQQLELYKSAEERLLKAIQKRSAPNLLVELGHNYQLQKDSLNAKLFYDKAIKTIEQNANNAYSAGRAFQELNLLEQAAFCYTKAMEIKPELNFNLKLARIYGEQGKVEKMFSSYIDFAEENPTYLNNIKRYVSDFITQDGSNQNNVSLKRTLLKKIQLSPNVMWNKMLSWLFIQQKQYNRAFAQEKAIYKRQQESLNRMIELGQIAQNQKEFTNALSIFNYIVETSQDIDTKLDAHLKVIEIKTKTAKPEDYAEIKTYYDTLFKTFDKTPQTLDIQVSYGHFLAFYLNKPEDAISLLKKTLKYNVSKTVLAKVKLELGDILVLETKFNKALIYYTQVERNLKNSIQAQEARFRVAKASYYKGDFDWAESQLKILKSSTTHLTANDALDLKLLISDNRAEDSLQVALKKYAKADLLAFQNKNNKAISVLETILKDHKAEVIVPQTLFKQALLLEQKQEYTKAKANYQKIIKDHKDSILMDNALYNLAEISVSHLAEIEAAKKLYETLLFEHSDSIFAADARKKFRALRGDTLN